jgi:type VI secretion system protein ImpM
VNALFAHTNATGAALPGWFGKLPGMGDFASRRLSIGFREAWDFWLQTGLAAQRARHGQNWVARYRESPLWYFALGAGTVDGRIWMGVLMPSVDGVGRYCPLTLAREFTLGTDIDDWWTRAGEAALDALDGDFDAERLEALLAERFAPSAHWPRETELLPPPAPCESLWRTSPAGENEMRLTGLPRGVRFNALFGGMPAACREEFEDE